MASEISLRFLGVRAIHSSPGRKNQTTGGNTGCIEIRDGQQRIFINAGFGISIAGDEILGQYVRDSVPTNCTVLFSDFFWDSMMGLPFFTPIHFKSTELDILSGAPAEDAKNGIDDVASNLFSPFNGVQGFKSDMSIRQLDGAMRLGAWQIRALPLPHPLTPYPVTVWRLTHDEGPDLGIVMICDNTPEAMGQVAGFLAGCQTLICAASKSPVVDGWDAHRTNFDDALGLAVAIGAKELFLTQFHPAMTDILLQSELTSLRHKQQQLVASGVPHRLSLDIHLGSEIETIKPAAKTQQLKAG
jgi:hypothetical protein